ncbi:hypothetical protein DFH09DRAFT_1083960 [Mycena vulgaris]|nr:hypothetical protein DFH09DRAFT_1083960 [Mycena vulgaris]
MSLVSAGVGRDRDEINKKKTQMEDINVPAPNQTGKPQKEVDDEEEDRDTPQASSADVRALWMGHGASLELQRQLRQFRGALRRDEISNAKQGRIDAFFKPKGQRRTGRTQDSGGAT